MRAKALDLRMVTVADRLSLQHHSREEGLPPESDQALRIQIPRMQGPESQARPTVFRSTPIFSSSHSITSPGLR